MERAFGFSFNVLTGAPAPSATITVRNAGTLVISTIFSDNGVTPLANPFTSDATTAYWRFYAASSLNYDVTISGAGITSYTLGDISLGGVFSLNGLVTNPQVFATATTGTDFTITSAASTHTFAIPDASATARGLITTGAQQIGGAKTFSTPIAAASGGTGLNAAPLNGQILIGNTAGPNTFVLTTLTATALQTTITNGAGSITIGTVQDIGTASSPVFTGLRVSGLTGLSLVGTTSNGTLNTTTLTDGQLLIGRTGLIPLAAQLTAGTNVTITSTSGSITINSAGAIASLNGLTAATQTFVTGTSAIAGGFFIDSVVSSHTFNLPYADTAVSGQVSTAAQTFAGAKLFNTTPRYVSGTVGATAIISGVINTNITTVTSAGAAEIDLMTYTLPASTLDGTHNSSVRVTAWGETNTTNAAKVLKAYFGSNISAFDIGSNNKTNSWYLTYTVTRIDGTHITSVVFTSRDDITFAATPLSHTAVFSSIVQDLSTPITIKMTATCAGGTMSQFGMVTEVL